MTICGFSKFSLKNFPNLERSRILKFYGKQDSKRSRIFNSIRGEQDSTPAGVCQSKQDLESIILYYTEVETKVAKKVVTGHEVIQKKTSQECIRSSILHQSS